MSEPRAKAGLIILDLFLLTLAYFFMAWVKSGPAYISGNYLIGFGVTVIIWVLCSFYLKKYHPHKKEKVLYFFRIIAYPNLLTVAFLSFIIYAFNTTFFSRLMVFGSLGIASGLEFIFFGLYTYAIRSQVMDDADAYLKAPPSAEDVKRMAESIIHSEVLETKQFLKETIAEECGLKMAEFIDLYANLASASTLMLSTTTRFNVLKQPDKAFDTIINIKKVNDIQYLNKFFEVVNHKLPQNGLFIGCAETKNQRKRRILAKYPPVINWVVYTLDFIVKRVFPKTKPTMKLYYLLTRGNNRVLTKAEILGRLYSCGFEVVNDTEASGYFVFVARRIKEPVFDMNPTYGPFIKLRRVGKNGKLINVYKFRTMHPYAEYLQEYMFRIHSLAEGGKIQNDFRVSTVGKVFRALWLDELPMLINWLKRDLKLVGVRPLSKHYFSLYDKDLQEMRTQTRPGLIPPFYADMPKTLEEIQESERKYLEAFFRNPIRTDFKYFWIALWNIVIKKARSA